jgi:hypothetical protein
VQQRTARLTTPFGDLSLPSTAIRTVRLAPLEETLAAAWSELATRENRNDLLIVRKGEALDFVGGVIGEISDKEIKLLVRDREVALPRERAFGLIFVRQATAQQLPLCELQTLAGDRLKVRGLELRNDALAARLATAGDVTVPLSKLSAIDFTLGRVKALADLLVEQVPHASSVILTPSLLEIHRNRTPLGQPLRIGDRDYSRGIWIHSGVTATFRLGREYRRFTGVMGLDSNSPEIGRYTPSVKVTISGDGKVLSEADVAWDDEPRNLDLDVSGVRDLEIRVQSPQQTPGILEHLDIGDARVIK